MSSSRRLKGVYRITTLGDEDKNYSIDFQPAGRRKMKGTITGTTMADAAAECRARVVRGGSGVLVPAFDDPHVIAGHGTVALEILNQTNIAELHAIFVCCGGGGLLAGLPACLSRVRVLAGLPE